MGAPYRCLSQRRRDMASVRKEINIEAAPERVWGALTDYHEVHKRVAPGFVVDSKPDGNARLIKFSNGTNAREVLVDRDAKLHRLVQPPNIGLEQLR